MTDTEVRDAAGMIIEHGKIIKIKGEMLDLNRTWDADGTNMRVTMTIRLNGGTYSTGSRVESGAVTVVKGIELYGPDAKCISPEHYDKMRAAEETVNKWDLPGVDDLGDIKKAPKEITKIMLGAVTRIAMYRSTLDVAFKFEQEVWDCKEIPETKRSMDRPAFMMALAYDSMKFEYDDIEDPMVKTIYGVLKIRWDDMSKDLQNAITKIEKKAIKAK